MKKWLMRIVLSIVGLSITLLLVGVIAFRIANRTNGTLVSSDVSRSYLLYVPERYDPTVPTPLVISIHGYAEWPAHQMQVSHWNDLADQYGFIVVYPSGINFPLRWRTRGAAGSETDPMLDVRFIADLIDSLETQYNIDPNPIYANGLSNGGGMSFVLSCQLSERLAAVGMVAGAYLYPWDECNPSRPVPAIVFHGTDDPIVPFQGGPSRAFDIPFPVILDWVKMYAERNQCAEKPTMRTLNAEISSMQFTDCTADVIYYEIEGGGHTWPGGEALPKWITGFTTNKIDATQLMWDFFQEHPLRD